MYNKLLYKKIIRSISKQIKHILNEDVQNFDVIEYGDEDIISNQDLDNMIGPEYQLINKVLTGKYNSISFTDKDIELWNNKVSGKIIDDKGTLGCNMTTYMLSTPSYFLMRPVNVKDIIEIDNGWLFTKDLKSVMVTTDNINKRMILSLMKSQTVNGKIGVFSVQPKFYSDDEYYLGLIIDTNNENIIIQNEELAAFLGFDENELQNDYITIDESLSDLLDLDLINMGIKKFKGIDFLYRFDYEYRK